MALKKNLHPDTPSLGFVSEMKMKLLQAILRSKWRRFAWQTPEAQGSDLSGNLFLCWNPSHRIGNECLAVGLRMLATEMALLVGQRFIKDILLLAPCCSAKSPATHPFSIY